MAIGLAAGAAATLFTIRRRTDEPLGYCGLIVGRCSLDEPEIAYELLKRFSQIMNRRLDATRIQLLDVYAAR